MPAVQLLGQTMHSYAQKTVDTVQTMKDVFYKTGILVLVGAVLLWLSIFLYVTFYYAYMPATSHVRPVHVQFRSCEKDRGICSYPSADIQFTKKHQFLMIGQPYKIYLHLEMPESPANKKLGMFMVCVNLHGEGNGTVARSCRSAMLHYRSNMLDTIIMVVFSPLFLFGNAEEKQTLSLELFADFLEDPTNPVTGAYVEIQTRHAEFYSATMFIHAHFTGVRYLMFHWPLLSAAVGVISNLFFMVIVCFLSWYHLFQQQESSYVARSERVLYVAKTHDEPTKSTAETDDNSSFEDASFLEDCKSEEFVPDENKEEGKSSPEERSSQSDSRDYMNEINGQEKFELVSEDQNESTD